MDRSDSYRFIKRTENLVTPKAVATMHRRAERLTRLPVGVQKWIVGRAGGKDQYVGFIVEPYSLFLAYEIRDEAAERAVRGLLLPVRTALPDHQLPHVELHHRPLSLPAASVPSASPMR